MHHVRSLIASRAVLLFQLLSPSNYNAEHLVHCLSVYYAPDNVFVFQVRMGDNILDEKVKDRHRGFPGTAVMTAVAAALKVEIKWHAVEEPWSVPCTPISCPGEYLGSI